VEAFPVKTSAWPVEETDSTESGLDCSLNSCGSFAWLDLDSSSWKTYQRSLLGGWEKFSENWPRQGLMLNGAVYPQQEWEPHIFVGASSLLPTPTATPYGTNQGGGAGRVGPVRASLDTLAKNQGGKLHPASVEQMMGFPIGWTDLELSETP